VTATVISQLKRLPNEDKDRLVEEIPAALDARLARDDPIVVIYAGKIVGVVDGRGRTATSNSTHKIVRFHASPHIFMSMRAKKS
jgi:hypothetical protein